MEYKEKSIYSVLYSPLTLYSQLRIIMLISAIESVENFRKKWNEQTNIAYCNLLHEIKCGLYLTAMSFN